MKITICVLNIITKNLFSSDSCILKVDKKKFFFQKAIAGDIYTARLRLTYVVVIAYTLRENNIFYKLNT